MQDSRSIFITGVTGLVGHAVLRRLLSVRPSLRAFVLIRDVASWSRIASELGDANVIPITGDICADGLRIAPNERATIRRGVTTFVHIAGDTTFSSTLDYARAVNTDGTRRVLELAADCVAPARFLYVSTAFVAGRRTGAICEDATVNDVGWVNAYERSKYEAEALVREHATDWVIARPSTVVCDALDGRITQLNAVHRALRLYHAGLVPMMPGAVQSAVDVVTTSYVADAIASLTLLDVSNQIVHLCAGDGALPLDELLDRTYAHWAVDPVWRRRGIARPALTDLATYSLFERTIEQVGEPSLKRITRALSHFVPQLALPKRFETTNAEAILGQRAPSVREFWTPMLHHLLAVRQEPATTGRAA